MKIAIRGGHCPKATGARGIIDELTEDRKVKNSVIKYLKMLGYDVLDVTPPDHTTSSHEDLYYGVIKANAWGANLFVSIHFNNAYNTYNGSLGTEVCVHSSFDTAQRVVNGLASLGFKNRGQKIRSGLYELRNTAMKAMIIEVCFVEATDDVSLYKQLGSNKIGKTIAESIANKKIENFKEVNNNESELNYSMHLFSKNWYLINYPDVAKNPIYKDNPYKHYIEYGFKEGRMPLPEVPPKYNEGEYLELNPDVAQAVARGQFTSGIEHYLMYGFNEDRKINK